MIIQHNMAAMNTNRQLGISQGALSKSTEKLSSGYRINRAGDDAAGLAISEKMRSQIRGLDRASANSQDGISLIQTAEGALNESQNILQRMRELAVQAANGTNTDSDREEIQKEINQLTSEVNRIANTTEFNTMKLLKGNTNKAEIGNVSSEALQEGVTGEIGGTLENFKVEQESKVAHSSTAVLRGNTSEATGKLTSDALDTASLGTKGEFASVSVGGITFTANKKGAALNGTEIKIVTVDDKASDGSESVEGLVKDGNSYYIILKQSTVDNKLETRQSLMSRIANFDSTESINATNISDLGLSTSAQTAVSFDSIGVKMTLPKDENTGKPVSNFLSSSTGLGNAVGDKLAGGVDEVRGEYTLEIDDYIKETDDVITIGGEKFVAKASGKDDPSAGEFALGDSHAIMTFQITGSASAGDTLAGEIGGFDLSTVTLAGGESAATIIDMIKTKAEAAGVHVAIDKDNGYVTLVSKEVGSTNATIGTSASVTPAGTATLTLTKHIELSGLDYNTDKTAAQAANLAAAIALNPNLSENFEIKDVNIGSNGKITIQEKVNCGGAGLDDNVLKKEISVSGAGQNDSITITNPLGQNGIEFVLVSSGIGGAVPQGNNNAGAALTPADMGTDAVIGQDNTDKNRFYINLGSTANGNTAAKIQKALREFTKNGTVKLNDGSVANFTDFTVESQGDWDRNTTNLANITKEFTATAGGVEEKAGTYSFDLTDAFKDGDVVTIAGKEFVAKSKDADISKGEFDISNTNKATQALRLKEAISADLDLSEKYKINVNGTKIKLEEKTASGTDMKETDVSSTNLGTQGQYKVDDISLLTDGAAITIDGQKIEVSSKNAHVGYDDGTAIKATDSPEDQTTALAAAINKNAELSKKYQATVEDGSLVLTQKVGSSEGPDITTTASTKGTFDVTFQVGANTGQSMTIAIGDNRSLSLGISGDGSSESIMADNGATAYYTKVSNVTDGTSNDNIEYALDVTSYEKATAAIGVIDDALSAISAQRAQLGAYQNRLEHTIANLDNTSENLQAAESRIRDVDMAEEMTNFSKNNILQQAAQSMLAQANQSTQGVLTLLR